MITYPSTHGVFEATSKTWPKDPRMWWTSLYGWCQYERTGRTDQSCRNWCGCVPPNLHKTFAIPHGGGGPGVGPICVAAHLADFLPQHPLVKTGEVPKDSISSSSWGSALACLISYGYIEMLEPVDWKKLQKWPFSMPTTSAKRLSLWYFIRVIKGERLMNWSLTAALLKIWYRSDDIAKRLMDYGFHAPTVSFQVAGTMMIEPTESENLEEIDRFWGHDLHQNGDRLRDEAVSHC